MTEYWVSNAKYWCDLCKCWLADTATAKANHEKGTGHKLNMQRKLREMRKAAADEKKEKAETEKALKKIEEAANNAFKKDRDKLVRSLKAPLSRCRRNDMERRKLVFHRNQMLHPCRDQHNHLLS